MAREQDLSVLVQETVDGLGQLMAEHIRLTTLELREDLKLALRGVASTALVIAAAAVGYLFLWLSVVVALAPTLGLAGAAALAGALHLVGAGVGLAVVRGTLARTRNLGGTVLEVHQTVTALSDASLKAAPSRAR